MTDKENMIEIEMVASNCDNSIDIKVKKELMVIGCPDRIFFHDYAKIDDKSFRYEFPDGKIGLIIKEKYICLACGKIWDMIAEEEHKRKVKDKRIKELLNKKP